MINAQYTGAPSVKTLRKKMNRQITFKRYTRRFCQPLRTARGEWGRRDGFLLRVESESGLGFGEVAPIPEFGTETFKAAEAFLRRLVRDSALEVPDDLPCCAFALSAALHVAAHPKRDYPVSALLPAGAAAVQIAEEKTDSGYQNLKWKIGIEPIGKEVVTCRSLLELLPPEVKLRLDANASLSLDDFEQWLELLVDFPAQIDYLEQPLPCGEEASMAEAMEASGVPIALDESLNAADGIRFLEAGAWAGPLVIKAPLMGNVTVLLSKLSPVAGQVVLSSVFETGVGLENVMALADALPELERPIGFDTVSAFDDPLNHLQPAPIICAADRAEYDPKQLWNWI